VPLYGQLAVFTIRPNLTRAFAAGTIDWGQGLLDGAGASTLANMAIGSAPGYEHRTIVNLTRNVLHNFLVGPLGIFGVELSVIQELCAQRWGVPSAVPPWRPQQGRAFAGRFLQAAGGATIALLSDVGAAPRRLALLEYQGAGSVATLYKEQDGANNLLNGWHDAEDMVVAGDFLARGHDQLLLINNRATPANPGRLTIVDYYLGSADQAYYEAWGDSELLDGWCDEGDIILAGDFLGHGHAQVLFINQDGTPPNIGRLTMVDYSSGVPAEAYLERWGDSPLLNGWHDPGDLVLAGDFLNRGCDQILFINQDGTPPNVGRLTIIDYSSGAPEQALLELWGDSVLLDGWHDAGDVVIAGDFLDRGYDQLLLIDNDGTAPETGRLTIIDFNSGAPQQVVLQTWGDVPELNGWSLADTVLVGRFSAGGEQVAFLPA
jgi:hypothetical protein